MDCGVHYGDELMYAGLSVSDCSSGLAGVAREQQGDYFSRLFHIKKNRCHVNVRKKKQGKESKP